MAYDNEILNDIFDKTDGYCHICDGKITFSAYGDVYHRKGWEVDHSIPRAKGGTDHLNNLLPAHTSCNRSKGAYSTRTARNWYGTGSAKDSWDEPMADTLAFLIKCGVFVGIFSLLWAALNKSSAPQESNLSSEQNNLS